MDIPEIFSLLEATVKDIATAPYDVDRFLGSLRFSNKEDDATVTVLAYVRTWCCVLRNLTDEHVKAIERAGYELEYYPDDDVYIWELGEAGDLNWISAKKFNDACEVFFEVLLT